MSWSRASDTSTCVRILLVEDNDGIRAGLEIILSLEGYETESVDSGDRAIERVREAHFDAIVLDLNINGSPASCIMTELRRQEADAASRTKVLVVSAADEIDHHAAGIGADLWLRKPFDPDQFLMKLEDMLSLASQPVREPMRYRYS